MIRIIDNKKVDITDDEFEIYKKLCDSYKSNGGPILFHDLFESNDDGIILFLKPPSKNFISYEIIFFIISIFQHQHIRVMYKTLEESISSFKEKEKKLHESFLENQKTLQENILLLKEEITELKKKVT